MPHIICNNVQVSFEPNSLTSKQAYNLMQSLTRAYMRSMSIACYPYTPTDTSQRAAYICAAQLVHDNLFEYESAQSIRNACIEKLKA